MQFGRIGIEKKMGLEEKAKDILLHRPDPKKISRGALMTVLQTLLQPAKRFGTRSEKRFSTAAYNHGRRFFKGDRPVFTSLFTPVEIIYAFGLLPFPLEPLGALAASFGIAPQLLEETEKWWLSPDFCSFHRAFLGACTCGLLPQPSFLIATSNACDGTMKSFSHVAHLVSRPLIFIDIPYRSEEEDVEYAASQIRDAVTDIESITGKKLRFDMLEKSFDCSNKMTALLSQIHDLRKASQPVLYGSEALNLVMVWSMFAGSRRGVRMLESYRDEIEKRMKNNFKDIKAKKRVLWLHLRPYHSGGIMSMLEEEFQAVIVAEEINTPVQEQLDSAHPWESLARKLLGQIWSGSVEKRLNNIRRIIESHRIDGVVQFLHWGCRQSNAAVRMIRDAVSVYGIPFLELDGDCVDPRNYAEGQYRTRIEAFFEIMDRR